MRNLMIFAAVMVVLGTSMAQMADRMSPRPAAASQWVWATHPTARRTNGDLAEP